VLRTGTGRRRKGRGSWEKEDIFGLGFAHDHTETVACKGRGAITTASGIIGGTCSHLGVSGRDAEEKRYLYQYRWLASEYQMGRPL